MKTPDGDVKEVPWAQLASYALFASSGEIRAWHSVIQIPERHCAANTGAW
jgi:hypothetical protein